jgi:tetratricopeptide (TPR) repeat protein
MRVGLPLSLAGAAVVVGAWLWWPRAEVEPPCRDAQAQLDGVWDEERRRTLETAILGTDLPYAADTWERIEHGLDEYAAAWVAKHTEICEATSVRGQQTPEVMDLRMRCLQRRRIELQEAVGVLAQANDTRVQQAVDLVFSLPAPSRCDDAEALAAELPPPEDPVVAEEVQALRQQLALAQSLHTAIEDERALTEVMAVARRANALGYAPLYAEALHQRGLVRASQGQYAEAEADLERAYLLAVEHGHERLAVRTVARLAYVVGHDRAEHERGLWWSRTGLAWNERLGDDPAVTADLLVTTGTLLADQGKLADALDHYRRALPIWEGTGHPIEVANTLGNIGSALTELGQLDQALDHYRRALALWEGALGPRHPRVASALNNIGSVLSDQGEQDEALVHYQRALAIWEGALGPEHPHVGSTLANIGNVLLAQGKNDEALEHLRRTLAIWDRALGPRHPMVGQLLANIGNVLRMQGELAQALDHLRRALAIMEESLPPGHPDLGLVLDNLGMTLEHLDRLDEAAEHYERAIATWEAALGPRYPKIAMSLVGLAEIALTRDDHVTARERAERALELRESGQVAPTQLAEARFLLARALWPERGERARARRLAEQALATYAEEGGIYEPDAARVEQWLQRTGPGPAGGVDER